jgi:hypothetical protein
MRNALLAACAATVLGFTPVMVSAQGISIGPGGVRVDDGRDRGYREERGYGRERGRSSRREVCRELRQACMAKNELGERGRGNCREYRETCQ